MEPKKGAPDNPVADMPDGIPLGGKNWTVPGTIRLGMNDLKGGDPERREQAQNTLRELGRKAKQLNAYIAAELYMVRDDDFPDRYFNIGVFQ